MAYVYGLGDKPSHNNWIGVWPPVDPAKTLKGYIERNFKGPGDVWLAIAVLNSGKIKEKLPRGSKQIILKRLAKAFSQ